MRLYLDSCVLIYALDGAEQLRRHTLQQLERYEIPWLRSPSLHHPHPNPHALRHFAACCQLCWRMPTIKLAATPAELTPTLPQLLIGSMACVPPLFFGQGG
jgi:hypothetical protein